MPRAILSREGAVTKGDRSYLESPCWRRAAMGIGLSMFGLSLVSWLRFVVTRRLDLNASLSPWTGKALGALFLGFTVVAAWFYLRILRRGIRGEPPASVLWVGVLIALAAATALPLTSSDVFAQLVYGRLSRLGFNPYTTEPQALGAGDPYLRTWDPHWKFGVVPYGPVVVLLEAIAGRANTVFASLAIFKLEMLLPALGTLAVAWAIGRGLGGGTKHSTTLFFLFNPLFFWELCGQAHNDVVMLLFTTAGIWAAQKSRPWLAVLCLSLAFYVKYAAAPVLGLYLVYIIGRSPRKAAVMALLVLCIGAVLIAPYWAGQDTFGALRAFHIDPENKTRSFTAMLCLLAFRHGPPGAENTTYHAALIVGRVLLLVVFVRALLRIKSLPDVFHESLVFFLVVDLIAAPWFQSWYVTWLLPLALVDRDPRWRWIVGVYSVLSLAQYSVDSKYDHWSYLVINTATLWMIYRHHRAHSRFSLQPLAADHLSTAKNEAK